MLGFGFLALFSMGLAGMMTGSDDSDTDQDINTQEDSELDSTTELSQNPSPGATDDPVAPSEMQDAAADSPEIVTPETTTEDEALVEEALPEQEPDATAIYRSYFPTTIKPEVEADPTQRAMDLATIYDAEGNEVPDEQILSAGPQTGDDADRDYLIDAPEGPHIIIAGHNPDTTYGITYNEDTTDLFAALNSDISGSEGSVEVETDEKVDANGTPFTDTLVTRTYEGSTQIILNVDETYVGAHVAHIELTNSADALHFEFTNMLSHVHLLYSDQDTQEGDSFFTTRTLYVVETPLSEDEIPTQAINSIINTGAYNDVDARLIAEVHLGNSELTLEGAGNDAAPNFQTITNFINDDAQISTNFYWKTDNSETVFAEDPNDPAPLVSAGESGSGSTASTAGGLSGLLLNAQPIP